MWVSPERIALALISAQCLTPTIVRFHPFKAVLSVYRYQRIIYRWAIFDPLVTLFRGRVTPIFSAVLLNWTNLFAFTTADE